MEKKAACPCLTSEGSLLLYRYWYQKEGKNKDSTLWFFILLRETGAIQLVFGGEAVDTSSIIMLRCIHMQKAVLQFAGGNGYPGYQPSDTIRNRK